MSALTSSILRSFKKWVLKEDVHESGEDVAGCDSA